MSKTEKAIEIALKAHKNQTDKIGVPHILHCMRVMSLVHDKGENHVILAILHDVVEDSDYGLDKIHSQFGTVIGDAVDAITRRDNEKYSDYVKRVALNPLARDVKMADIIDNSDVKRMYYLDKDTRDNFQDKHIPAYEYLVRSYGQ